MCFKKIQENFIGQKDYLDICLKDYEEKMAKLEDNFLRMFQKKDFFLK